MFPFCKPNSPSSESSSNHSETENSSNGRSGNVEIPYIDVHKYLDLELVYEETGSNDGFSNPRKNVFQYANEFSDDIFVRTRLKKVGGQVQRSIGCRFCNISIGPRADRIREHVNSRKHQRNKAKKINNFPGIRKDDSCNIVSQSQSSSTQNENFAETSLLLSGMNAATGQVPHQSASTMVSAPIDPVPAPAVFDLRKNRKNPTMPRKIDQAKSPIASVANPCSSILKSLASSYASGAHPSKMNANSSYSCVQASTSATGNTLSQGTGSNCYRKLHSEHKAHGFVKALKFFRLVMGNAHKYSTFSKRRENDEFTDVKLVCEGKFIKCHRLVLAEYSSVLEKLLLDAQNNTEKDTIIILKDSIKHWEIDALVDLMYEGEICIHLDLLSPLMKVANEIQLKPIQVQIFPCNQFVTTNESTNIQPSSSKMAIKLVQTFGNQSAKFSSKRNKFWVPLNKVKTSSSDNNPEGNITTGTITSEPANVLDLIVQNAETCSQGSCPEPSSSSTEASNRREMESPIGTIAALYWD